MLSYFLKHILCNYTLLCQVIMSIQFCTTWTVLSQLLKPDFAFPPPAPPSDLPAPLPAYSSQNCCNDESSKNHAPKNVSGLPPSCEHRTHRDRDGAAVVSRWEHRKGRCEWGRPMWRLSRGVPLAPPTSLLRSIQDTFTCECPSMKHPTNHPSEKITKK